MAELLARRYADFAAGLSHRDVPDDVSRAGYLHIVDSIGVSIAGAAPSEPSGQAARKLAAKWKEPGGGATVFGIGTTCRTDLGAFLNGALAQALEMDDKHGSSLARPGSTVVPAALAVAEDAGLTVADAVTAVVAGYEVMIRLGFVAGERFLERGYHTSSLLGAFGTVATIGCLKSHTPDQIVNAFGIAGTMASGIQESTRTGSTSKTLHGGWGAHSGILAMEVGASGITGPESVFEGAMGFFQTHLTPIEGELDWARGADGLGTRWYLPDTGFKPYPCCQLIHAFIEAGKQILTEMTNDGVGTSAITGISCKLAEPGLTLVTEPKDRKKTPQTLHEARFSLPFTVASTMLYGDIGLDSFSDARLADPDILALAALVRSADDPESDYPAHCPARVEVEVSGKVYGRHIPFHPGCPEAPLSVSDVLDKFARNTSWLLGDRAHDVGATVLALPASSGIGAIVAEITRASSGSKERITAGQVQ